MILRIFFILDVKWLQIMSQFAMILQMFIIPKEFDKTLTFKVYRPTGLSCLHVFFARIVSVETASVVRGNNS